MNPAKNKNTNFLHTKFYQTTVYTISISSYQSEILVVLLPFFRANIPPFTCARSILQPMTKDGHDTDADSLDVLALCRDISQEVINLQSGI